MDLTQTKLSKSEWESIETPVSVDEIEILKMMMRGNSDVNLKYNKNNSIFTFLKIEYSSQMEDYIYNKYLSTTVKDFVKKYSVSFIKITVSSNPQIKKADLIRMNKNSNVILEKNNIYEYVLLEHIEKILSYSAKKSSKLEFHYYTLRKMILNNVPLINRHIVAISTIVLKHLEDRISIPTIIERAVECIEKNENLLKYSDMRLYEHQKEIITICKNTNPKLVLYIAPTGTGKTLTPIALAQNNKIIFVCAARHVGLALARSAISVGVKVAFAFGCSSADDIRLHYFSAKEYSKNWKTGGIWKVDNSVGLKVEIMICDIKSYLYAMYYMVSFNEKKNIIVYWDEPTITLDYDNHALHPVIKRNWRENIIPNMVLSSATLPKLHELTETINDYKTKFENAEIFNIVSHDCKKSIPIVNNNGYVVLPHYLSNDYSEIQKIANHCENYLTLLRYFDLKEIARFITIVQDDKYTLPKHKINRSFNSIDDIDMTSIKLYYLKVLKNIIDGRWSELYDLLIQNREVRICANTTIDAKGNRIQKVKSVELSSFSKSNFSGEPIKRLASEQPQTQNYNVASQPTSGNCAIYVTTKDAFTLTDGPTLFISNDVEKVAKFCIQQANIPVVVMQDIMDKIYFNNNINERIIKLERDLEDICNKSTTKDKDDADDKKSSKGGDNDHKSNRSSASNTTELGKVTLQLETLRSMIKIATLNETFVPNKTSHIQKWAETLHSSNSFSSNIEEETITEIMLLTGIEDSWKVLLLMGIGVFTHHENIAYTEIMKKLADQQKLYMIISSSDYIYGTNYQFCHAYISKDMDLTQEKIIQAMGRIGRNKIQQDYTVRFRDDNQILKLFTSDTEKPEIINMNKLFNSLNEC